MLFKCLTTILFLLTCVFHFQLNCEDNCTLISPLISIYCGSVCVIYGTAQTRYCALSCSVHAPNETEFYKCVDPCYEEPKTNQTCEKHCRDFHPRRQSLICPKVCRENIQSGFHNCYFRCGIKTNTTAAFKQCANDCHKPGNSWDPKEYESLFTSHS
ncbi:unnamed protein product [Trichobilharzia szidati]|nr:unnamed protein product [Trichobilharzia szidati]